MTEQVAPTTPRRIDRDFRWRGDDVSRLESFSDAVFAIVLALLFLRTAPPETFYQLKAAMKGLLPFAATFAIIAYVWVEHWLFSRRYDIRDPWTAFLNLLLLFLLLFYAYPLKYLFTIIFIGFFGPIGDVTQETMMQGFNNEWDNVVLMYLFYSVGYGMIFLVLGLMFRHAYRLREMLQLNELEIYQTRASAVRCFVQLGFAVTSIALALLGVGLRIGVPGWIYMLLGPVMGTIGYMQGRRVDKLRAK